MKRFAVLIVLMALSLRHAFLYAQDGAAGGRALCVAREFYHQRMSSTNAVRTRSLSSDLQYATSVGQCSLFTPADERGFVLTAGTDHPVVVGYSLEAPAHGVMPAVLSGLLQGVDEAGLEGMAGQTPGSTTVSYYPVPPLLRSVWCQTAPFNGMCPYYRYDDGHVSAEPCVVGCVATATSEVMRHYAHPAVLLDTLYGWQTPNYALDTVPAGKPIDWGQILDTYDNGYTPEQARAVQELSLYCGMAAHMTYGEYASSASVWRMEESLRNTFGYRYVCMHDRARYSPLAWRSLVARELQRGVPLVYVGYTCAFSGHAFVVDGIDEQGFCHVRWGEGGVYNGYFDLDVLNAYENPSDATQLGRELGHFANQYMMAIHPEPLDSLRADTLTYCSTDIELEALTFARTPDTNGYNTASFGLLNHSSDTISLTLLAFTTQTPDSIDWSKVQEAGLTTVQLLPHTAQPVPAHLHCRFAQAGSQYFGITIDQDTTLCLLPIEVQEARGPVQLEVGPIRVLELDAHQATFAVSYRNLSDSVWAAPVIPYTLQCMGEARDAAHYVMLSVEPQGCCTDTVTFVGLKAGTSYTLGVRYPWEFACSMDFTTPGADDVHDAAVALRDTRLYLYNIQGMLVGSLWPWELADCLARLTQGIYIIAYPDRREKIWVGGPRQ